MTTKTVLLKDITENLNTKRKPLNREQRNLRKTQELYPYCGANGILEYIDAYIFDEEILCLAEDGGSWGFNEKSTYIMSEPCWVNNHAHVLKAGKDVKLKFLYYFLNYKDLTRYITGTTRGKLTRASLNRIQIPLPDLSTQEKIIHILDLAHTILEKRQTQLDALSALRQSVFLNMFGDPIVNNKKFATMQGKELFKLSSGKFLAKKFRKAEDGYPAYGGNGINGYATKYLVEDPTIVIGRVGANCGNVHLTRKQAWISDNAMYIKELQTDVRLLFLKYLFSMIDFNQFAEHSGQPKITQKPIYELDYIVPSIDKQLEFEQTIDKINHQEQTLQKSLQGIEKLIEGLTHQAFAESI